MRTYLPLMSHNPTVAQTIRVGAVIILLLVSGCAGDDAVSDEERQRAIDAAMDVYEREAAAGRDFSNGPCIAEQLEELPNWSVDIAHDPRREIDDQPENQCQAYRDGETEHFVELDPEGNLFRAE